MAYIGFFFGGGLGVQVAAFLGAKGSDAVAVVIGGVLGGTVAILVAYALGKGVTRLLEKVLVGSSLVKPQGARRL